jgi:hypothetical protein
LISPEIGGRIDIGKPNEWILVPSFAIDYFVTSSSSSFSGTLVKINVRVGYSFEDDVFGKLFGK